MKINLHILFFFAGLLWFFSGMNHQLNAKGRPDPFDIPLHNGQVLRIQACRNEIFRIRIPPTGEFQETVMERYGSSKRIGNHRCTHKKKNGKHIISTESYRLTVDPLAGDITVTDNNGILVVERISFIQPKDAIAHELAASLNTYFGEIRQDEAIIGSGKSDTPIQAQLLDEVGNLSKGRIIGVTLKEEERFYGGGSTSRTNIQHRGTALRMWATYKKTEIPMPFIISSEGWGIFNNTTAKNYLDIGRFQKDNLFVYNSEGDPEFLLVTRQAMTEVIDHYTVSQEGLPMPKWGYGLAFGVIQWKINWYPERCTSFRKSSSL